MSRTLEDIAGTMGMQTAIRLARAYGGRTLRVPQDVTEIHPLSIALGFEAAQAFTREFAGMAIDVPAERTALIALRDRAIAEAAKNGASVHGLARAHDLSRRMIRKILGKAGVVSVPPSDQRRRPLPSEG